MDREKAIETISIFVRRARRIAAHSLMRDEAKVEDWCHPSMTLQVDDETVRSVWVPPDAERFEALLARVRPIQLARESIYFPKVLAALGIFSDELSQHTINQLAEQWSSVDESDPKSSLLFSIQTISDTITPSSSVSDKILAGGYIYSDTVHADVKEQRREALNFSLAERFQAVVPIIFAQAVLITRALECTRSLYHQGRIPLTDQIWTEPVDVSPEDFVREGSFYFKLDDSSAPPSALTTDDLSDYTPLTASSLKPQETSAPVLIQLMAEGEVLQNVQGEYRSYGTDWRLHLGENICISSGEEGSARISSSQPDTNQGLLKILELQHWLSRTRELRAFIGIHQVLRLDRGSMFLPRDDRRETLLVVVAHLVSVEDSLGVQLDVLQKWPSKTEVEYLDYIRQILDGGQVGLIASPIEVNAPPPCPKFILAKGIHVQVGNVDIALPDLYAYHPQMTVVEVTSSQNPSEVLYEVRTPENCPLLVFDPLRTNPGPSDA